MGAARRQLVLNWDPRRDQWGLQWVASPTEAPWDTGDTISHAQPVVMGPSRTPHYPAREAPAAGPAPGSLL